MNDIHLALKAAQDAVGVGLEADTDERTEIRSGIRNGRRRRTTGAVLASVAALAIVSVGAVTLTRGAPDPTAPAGFDVPSPAPSPSTSAPEAVIDRVYDDYDGPVEVSLAGGGTVAFTASTESKAATVMSEDPTAGPTLAPVDPELLAQVTDGWALIEATEQTEDDHFGHVSSHLFLASPEGRSVEIADLDALADELGISGSRFIEDVAFDPVDDRALLGFHDPDGRYVLLLWALESG